MVGVPLKLTTLMVKRQLLPRGPTSSMGRGFSEVDTVTGTLAFNLLVCALRNFTRTRGEGFVTVRLMLLVVVNACFVHHRLGRAAPVLPMSLLGVPVFTLSVNASVASFATRVLTVISLPFFVRGVLKCDTMRVNLLLAP